MDAGKIYWADFSTDKIQRANLDGSQVENLVATGARKIQRGNLNGSNVEDLVTRLGEPRGLALDLAAGRMYWTDSGRDRIQSADLDGSNIQDLVTGIPGPTSIVLE